ncbi:maleylpyruvate isomerase family mycothiol-dependent enzyme [Williamsia muralis]|uniref:maleylpyruvate isomerase family mycothiol-dependent enzyme n=1 Tax=Williamsia marianensis TaxID=85044 RepID=UPI003F163023
MGSNFSAVWPVVHAERERLVKDLSDIPADAWATPSLCPGWDVHDVLAHLIDGALTTRLGFVRRMMANRFDFDRDNSAGIARQKRADPGQTIEALVEVITSTRTPPANSSTRFAEIFVHGEDIRRPLGIDADYPVDPVVEALRYQAKTAVGFGGGRERVVGLRLTATDSDVVLGGADADEVRGPAIDLLLAVSGRPVPPGALVGPGAAKLATAA